MTKAELIEALESMNDEDEIFVKVQTGNYWRQIAVKSVDSLDNESVRYSNYLESLEVVEEDEFNSDNIENGEVKYVWALTLK